MQHEPLSKRMQRGSIVLVCLLAIIAFIPRLYFYFHPSEKLEVIRTVEEFDEVFKENSEKKSVERAARKGKKAKFSVPPAKFDPNQYSKEDWMKLGMSEKQAETILKFNKYGIYNHTDLRKIKMIDDEFFAIIKDSIFYPEKKAKENYPKTNYEPLKTARLVELNSATKEELMELRGVKDHFSNKIIEYRTKLGGFVRKEQLMEIYGMTEENYERIAPAVKIDLSYVQQININACTAFELQKHPYITKNVANSIVKIRAKWEKYSNFEQLLESELIDQELLKKIQPYLTLTK